MHGDHDFFVWSSSVYTPLTTVYIKRTHQAMKPVTSKRTISIIDKSHGHVFCVLERIVSSKHFFWMPKTQFYDWGKITLKPRFWIFKRILSSRWFFLTPKSYHLCFRWNKRKVTSPRSTHRRATNGPQAICHLNGISLVGLWWLDVVW